MALGDSLRRRHGARQVGAEGKDRPPRSRPAPGSRRFTLRHWLLAALVILVGSFLVGYLLSTQVLFPRPETAGTGSPVPELYGQTRAEAVTTIREAGFEVGEITEMASLETTRGRVLAQAPIPGQQLRAGAAVAFAVSGGPPELRVPPVYGMTERSARDLLEATGFDIEVDQVRTDAAPPGVVVRSEPEPGVTRTLPATITLLVAVAPAGDTLDTMEPGVPPVGTLEPRGSPTSRPPSGGGR